MIVREKDDVKGMQIALEIITGNIIDWKIRKKEARSFHDDNAFNTTVIVLKVLENLKEEVEKEILMIRLMGKENC